MLKTEFESYLISNWPSDHVAVDIKYSHMKKERFDKIKRIVLFDNIVTISLKYLDKDANVTDKHMVKMINDEISKPKEMINISPDELNNKFCAARRDIIKDLIHQNEEKSDDIMKVIQSLSEYLGEENEVIPEQFKSRIMIEEHPHEKEVEKPKKVYDM
jgi:hypothetical protein